MLIGQNTRNKIINGRFDYWQRQTTFTNPASFAYTADRFRVEYDGTIGVFQILRQAFTFGQTDVPGNPEYFYRWNHTAPGSGSTYRAVQQPIEDVNTFSGKNCTVTFYAKADAARTMNLFMSQYFGTGGSPSAGVVTSPQAVSLTTSWQRFRLTFSIPSITGKTIGTNNNDALFLSFLLPVNTNMTIDLASISLVEGDHEADFELAGGSVAGELELCQRFYEKSYHLGTFPGAPDATGMWSYTGIPAGGAHRITSPFKVRKRATPVVTIYNPINGATNSVARDVSGNVTPSFSIANETHWGYEVSTGAGDPRLYAQFTAEAEI